MYLPLISSTVPPVTRLAELLFVRQNRITTWRSPRKEQRRSAWKLCTPKWWADSGERFLVRQGGPTERKTMIDRQHDLPALQRAKVLNICRNAGVGNPESFHQLTWHPFKPNRATTGHVQAKKCLELLSSLLETARMYRASWQRYSL